MPDLLLNIRRKLANYRSYFPGLNADFIKVGYLGQSPLMPAMSVVPDRMEITKRQAGGRFTVTRTVAVQIYEDAVAEGQAQARLRGHAERLREIMTNDIGFMFEFGNRKSSVFAFDWLPITYSDTNVTLRGHKVRMAEVSLMLKSKEWRPKQKTKPTEIVKATDDEIFDRIFKKVFNNRFSKLKGVKEFRRSEEAPKLAGATYTQQMSNGAVERTYAGGDLFDMTVIMGMWTKIYPDEKSLLFNCLMQERLLDIVEEDETFGGRLMNSEMQAIDWDERDTANASFYVSRMNLLCRKHESTLFGN